jgi:hypothetical protein
VSSFATDDDAVGADIVCGTVVTAIEVLFADGEEFPEEFVAIT